MSVFPQSSRLKKQKDFALFFKRSRYIHYRYFILYYAKTQFLLPKMAFVASKKIGNAVHRNRAKRLLREVARSHEKIPAGAHDLVWVAKKGIHGQSAQALKAALHESQQRLWFLF